MEGNHLKKILAAFMAAVLILTPAGNFIFQDHATTVEAKGYKSGKKSFNMNNSKTQSNIQKKQDDTTTTNKTNSTATTPKGGFASGGLMKGIMLGGLAGLLFGGLLANMGALGPIIGLFINVLAIMFVISLIRNFFANKRRRE